MNNDDYVFVIFNEELSDDLVVRYFANIGLRVTLIYAGDSGVQGVECAKGNIGGLERISVLLSSGELNKLILRIVDGDQEIDVNDLEKSLKNMSKELREGVNSWNYALRKPNAPRSPPPKMDSFYDPKTGAYYD